jgi:hypothetical protein
MNDIEWNVEFDHSTIYGPNYVFAEIKTRLDLEIFTRRFYKSNKKVPLVSQRMIFFQDNHKMRLVPWVTYTNSFLFESLANFVLEMHQFGFIDHFVSLNMPSEIPKPEDPGPQILTMYMLSAGFIVWVVTFVVASISFIFEHIYKFITDKRAQKNKKIISKIIQVKEFENNQM